MESPVPPQGWEPAWFGAGAAILPPALQAGAAAEKHGAADPKENFATATMAAHLSNA